MIFVKWFLYITTLLGFIWFVFFYGGSGVSNKVSVIENIEKTPFEQQIVQAEDVFDSSETESFIDTKMLPKENVEQIDMPDNTPENSLPDINLKSKYLIFIGSFSNKANAVKMQKMAKARGKNSIIIYKQPYHRVVVAGTNDEKDAKNLVAHFTHALGERSFAYANY